MDLNEQLLYFKEISQKYALSDAREMVEFLSIKAADRNLYLAVVGEFSSGKSTFINALIGRHLLKEAVKPTTACATYIKKGKKSLELAVKFGNGIFRATEDDLTKLNQYIGANYGIDANNMQQMIDILTSDQSVARNVLSLEILVPNINLPDNIVIIDTPGFNPGEESVNNHFEVTKDVVANRADAALVLIPSDQPFSSSIRKFLLDYSSSYLHRCIYVITMGDHKTKDERTEIIQYVRNRLKSDFALDEPALFCESAISKLPLVKIPKSLADELEMWQSEFDYLKQFLGTRLVRQKEVILSEHMLNLSLSLSKKMKSSLEQRQNEYTEHKRILDNGRIEHIQDVSSSLALKAKANMASAYSQANDKIRSMIRSRNNECASFADRTLTRQNAFKFSSEVEPKVSEFAKKCAESVLRDVNSIVKSNVKPFVDKQIEIMKMEFDSHYSMFPTLNIVEKDLDVHISRFNLPAVSFGSTNAIVSETDEKGAKIFGKSALGAAAAGAAIGSVVPIVGTGFGAMVGFIAGIAFAGKKSDELEDETYPSVKSSMNSEITKFFSSISKNIDDQFVDIQNKINHAFVNYTNLHVKRYGYAVDDLIHQQETDIQEAQKSINEITTHMRTLDEIQANVEYTIICLKQQR